MVEMVGIRYNRQGIRAEVKEPRGRRGCHRQAQEGGGRGLHRLTRNPPGRLLAQSLSALARSPHFGKHPWLVRPLKKGVRTPRRQSHKRLLGDRWRWRLGWGRGGCQVRRVCSAGLGSHLRPWPVPLRLAYLAVLCTLALASQSEEEGRLVGPSTWMGLG